MSLDQAHPVAAPAVGSFAAVVWAARQFDQESALEMERQIDEFIVLRNAYQAEQQRTQIELLRRLMDQLA
jgi:hypothetical protein